MSHSSWLVSAVTLLVTSFISSAHAEPTPLKKLAVQKPTALAQTRLKLKSSVQPLKARLDELRLKISLPVAQIPPLAPVQAAAQVTLGATVTSVPGAHVFATDLEVWAGGPLPVEGVVPGISYGARGQFFILYALAGTEGKDLVFECTGAFSPSMDIRGYAVTSSQEIGAVSSTVASTQNNTKIKVVIDPVDVGAAPHLLFALSDVGMNDAWRLTSCTVEKK